MRAMKALAVLGMGLLLTLLIFPWLDGLRDTWYHPVTPVLHEHINVGDDIDISVASDNWAAQVFVVSTGYTQDAMKVKVWHSGAGTLTVALYHGDMSGEPSGAAIVSGTAAASTLSGSSPGAWATVTWSTVQSLTAGTYDVVLHYSGTGAVYWRAVSGGSGCWYSTDNGSSWSPYSSGGGGCGGGGGPT